MRITQNNRCTWYFHVRMIYSRWEQRASGTSGVIVAFSCLYRFIGSLVFHPRRTFYEYLGIRMNRRLGAVAVVTGFLLGWFLLPRFLGERSYEASFGPLGVVRTSKEDFLIKGEHMTILSGAIHYFRVVPDYWYDRLIKLKAMGLNTVETYIPWNMHEPIPGEYDFSGILDVRRFIRTAQKLGLHVIIRPGPYICAEWELGGLPGWLLHDPNMKLRSTHPPFLAAVERYFDHLFPIIAPLQVSYGGPVIGFQVENEYTYYGNDSNYMRAVHDMMRKRGVVELLFTSDGVKGLKNAMTFLPPEVILMINFQSNPDKSLAALQKFQPGRPMMVMEYWTGWFRHWNEPRPERSLSPQEAADGLKTILSMKSSVNLYMFHDYDAPLSEAGDITEKYKMMREVILSNAPPSSLPHPLPDIPVDLPKARYGELQFTLYIPIVDTLNYFPEPVNIKYPVSMEMLSVNKGSGQSYGFILYRTVIDAGARKVTISKLRDHGVAMVNSVPVKKLTWFAEQTFLLPEDNTGGQKVLDILVENCGRTNFAKQLEFRKGILGDVLVDGVKHSSWKAYSLEFKYSFTTSIEGGGLWKRTPPSGSPGPALYKASFNIKSQPLDTFADMSGWSKGVVFINGVNIGRYWSVGPQYSLYIPAPLLRRGPNTAFSTSEIWYAYLDYGTNYCNLRNLADGAGITTATYGFTEHTSDDVCTQYSSHNCEKY
ncbi:beta-galactosidase-1-like protein 2 isoform X3 [Dysidea avara]|uniref:beta-galactosidase-1-like protein 2 isoform X3 n=1 Tax=Dysidea avara TaxID=196820 RepID=UPI00332F6ADA